MSKVPFTTIYENFVNRYSQGGFLQGDYVKLTKDAAKCSELSTQHKALVKELIKTNARLRVVNIQSKHSNISALPAGTASDFRAIIAPEISPGLTGGYIVVPMNCIELETAWEDAPQKPFDPKNARDNEHQTKVDSNQPTEKFSDIYDSGKGTQTDFGKV